MMKEYYARHYLEYYNKTVSVDSSLFLSEFAKRIKPGGRIIDVGCGSGRDLLWLKQKGFNPSGLERSDGLAELARRRSGCDVVLADYEQYDFSAIQVDGLLFSASLVHVSHLRIKSVISNALNALKEDGVLYISVKEGDNTKIDKAGRTFYLWRDKNLRTIFAELNLEVKHFSESESVLNSGEVWLGYVLKQI